jgi:hypothetical protein
MKLLRFPHANIGLHEKPEYILLAAVVAVISITILWFILKKIIKD